MGNRIETAKSARSKCVTCNGVILKGTPRLSEEYNDIGIPDLIHRFYHLRCAAAVHPEMVGAALAHVDDGVEFDREEIEAKIGPAIALATEQRKQKYLAQQVEKEAKKLVVVEADETTTQLLAQLDGAPEDAGTLAVVADQLQARGDIRGELIALQLGKSTSAAVALEGDDDEETDAEDRIAETKRRAQRIAELMEKLSVPLDHGDRAVWGVGFVRRLELVGKTGTRLAALEPIWKHPSLRFLSELRITFSSNLDTGYIARLREHVPHSLRRLEIGDDAAHVLAGLAPFVAQLPRLEVLSVSGKGFATRAEPLAHPTLKRLELGLDQRHGTSDLPHAWPFIAAKALPAVDTIVIRAGVSDAGMDKLGLTAAALATKGWLKKPLHLGWVQALNPIAPDDVTQLAEALGKKKLARLDLTGTKVPLALREPLAQLTAELVAPDLAIASDATLYVEHTAKPEWGRGKVVSRKDGKVEVDFGRKIGKKVFKVDAPFIKLLA